MPASVSGLVCAIARMQDAATESENAYPKR
jgi:hypothetical protein